MKIIDSKFLPKFLTHSKLRKFNGDFIEVNRDYKHYSCIHCSNGNNGDTPTEATIKDFSEISKLYIEHNKITDKTDYLLLFMDDTELACAPKNPRFALRPLGINPFSNLSSELTTVKNDSALNNDIKLSFLISNSIFEQVQKKNIELTENMLLVIKST